MTDLIQFEGNGQDLSVDEITATMEKFAQVFAKVKAIALSGTNSGDWCDQSGKPYLMKSGSEKIKNLFGLTITGKQWEKHNYEDDNGHYYVVVYSANFSWKMGSIEMTGTCSSRDKFFGKDKAYSDIEFTNVLKKSETNLMGRGIKALLGINNLTWDDLKAVGIDKNGSAKVEYRKQEAASADMESKKQKLRELILAHVGGGANEARELLKEMTTFTKTDGTIFDGHTDINKLSEKSLDICIKQMEGKQ